MLRVTAFLFLRILQTYATRSGVLISQSSVPLRSFSREDSIAQPEQRTYFYRANLGYCLGEEHDDDDDDDDKHAVPTFPVPMLQSFFSRRTIRVQFAVTCISRLSARWTSKNDRHVSRAPTRASINNFTPLLKRPSRGGTSRGPAGERKLAKHAEFKWLSITLRDQYDYVPISEIIIILSYADFASPFLSLSVFLSLLRARAQPNISSLSFWYIIAVHYNVVTRSDGSLPTPPRFRSPNGSSNTRTLFWKCAKPRAGFTRKYLQCLARALRLTL